MHFLKKEKCVQNIKKINKTDMVREAYVLKIIKLDICMEHLEKKQIFTYFRLNLKSFAGIM